jgi:L-serine dehydratase
MFLSVFELFKIGIGPSSSHTMGPMTAAVRFLEEVARGDWPRPAQAKVHRLKASLHGSLAYTGIGHGTDRAVILGLNGLTPLTVDPDTADAVIEEVARSGRVAPQGHPAYLFDPTADLVLDRKTPLPGHANGMAFSAWDRQGRMLLRRVYFSIGGGFVVSEEELQRLKAEGPVRGSGDKSVPYPFRNAREMLAMAAASGLSIAAMKRANEETTMSRAELDAGLDGIWAAMRGCIERGISREGIMPGGLKVRRRAARLHDRLQEDSTRNTPNPLLANDWLSVYAMAVNEENAAGGRVVTAPTNGAAGVMPAVMRYWLHFHLEADTASIRDFLLTAAAVGGIIKHNASISGAEVGCQGEVGSASAMAAAGLCAVMGGTPDRAGASSGHDLRSRRRAGAGAVHRAQCARRGQGGHRRLAGDQGRRQPFRAARRRHRDHAPDRHGHERALQGDQPRRAGRQRRRMLKSQCRSI